MAAVVKRPAGGAFGQWLNEKRAEITAQVAAEGGKGVTAICKKAGERWKAMSAEEKAPFDQKYKEAKLAFDDYKSSDAYVKPEKKEKRRSKKDDKPKQDPNKPKRPVGGAYGIFMNEKRAEYTKMAADVGEKGLGAVAKLISEAFKKLSDDEKATYVQRAQKAQEEYKEKAEKYAKDNPKAQEESKAEKAKKGAPKKGAPKKGKRAASNEKAGAPKKAKTDTPADLKPNPNFTPANIDQCLCRARTWDKARGGQCTRAPVEGKDMCVLHQRQSDGGTLSHGRVDGPVPEKKLAEFQKAMRGA